MSVIRNRGDAAIRQILVGIAEDWLESHIKEHERREGGTFTALPTSRNEFVVAAESAYYEALGYFTWRHDVPRDGERSVDDVMIDCPDDRIPALYAHYSASDELLYIGKTIHARTRQISHRRHAHWWGEISRIVFWTFEDVDELSEAEKSAIRARTPLHNILGNSGRWS